MTAAKLSLCVGVTGHRDIEAGSLATVEARVSEAFERLEKGFACPIVVLSSLADGADRVVARIGLDRGHRLVVPLPLAVEDYAEDFQTPQSRREFHELMARATRVFVADRIAARDGEEPRDTAYRSAGMAVARTSHVLLALWNGIDNGKPGGTADVVAIKRRHGAVVCVVTPRQSDTTKPAVALDWPARTDPVWERVAAMARIIGRFNDDAARLDAQAPARVHQSRANLYDKVPQAPAAIAAIERLASLHAVSDALAIRRQAWVRRGWRLLLALSVLGVVALGEFAHDHDHPRRWLAGYLVVIAVALGLYGAMKYLRTQSRFLEYRALAEALRVAFFWRIAGLPGEPADQYPSHLAREIESVSMALRSEEIHLERPSPDEAGLAFAIRHWVEGQKRFFERAARRDALRGLWLKRGSSAALAAGIALAAVTFALIVGPWPVVIADRHLHVLILGMVLLPAIGGALATYTDRLGHETQARQYERMFDLFELASGEIGAHRDNPRQQRDVMVRLAGEALSEHAQWVVLHRQRPFEVKAGG